MLTDGRAVQRCSRAAGIHVLLKSAAAEAVETVAHLLLERSPVRGDRGGASHHRLDNDPAERLEVERRSPDGYCGSHDPGPIRRFEWSEVGDVVTFHGCIDPSEPVAVVLQ